MCILSSGDPVFEREYIFLKGLRYFKLLELLNREDEELFRFCEEKCVFCSALDNCFFIQGDSVILALILREAIKKLV